MRLAFLTTLLLSALATPGWASEGPRFATLKTRAALHGVITGHHERTGALPESPAHIGALVRMVRAEVALQGGVPVDAWGHAFVYRPDGDASFALYSTGPDGVDALGQGDDLGLQPGDEVPEAVRRAQQLFPLAVLVSVAPVAWALIRRARRAALS